MPETPSYSRLVLASNNPGKCREVHALLRGKGIEVVSQAQFAVREVEETGTTFVENAIIKARAAAMASGLPTLADDSGLVVDALDGAPGVRSARYAGVDASDADNNRKLVQVLREVSEEQRSARFVSLLVLLRHAQDPLPLMFQGVWEGRILHQPRGDSGFGYDPLFWVPQRGCSSAELALEEKNRLSHRGQALHKLVEHLGTM